MQRFFTSFIEEKNNLNAQLERNVNLDYIILLEYYSEYPDINYEDYGAGWQCL